MHKTGLLSKIITIIFCFILSCTSDSDVLYYSEKNAQQPEQSSPSSSSSTTIAQRLRGIWIIGGTDDTSLISEVDLYDPISDTWYENLTTFPSPRQNFAIASGIGKIYIFGGAVSGTPVDRVDIFDPESLAWSSGTTGSSGASPNNATTSVRGAGAAYTNGRFFLMGGHDGSANIRQLYEYNPANDTWTQKNSTVGIAQYREDIAYCSAMGALLSIGGRYNTTTIRYYNYLNYSSYTYDDAAMRYLPSYYSEGVGLFGGSAQAREKKVFFTGGSSSYSSPSGRSSLYIFDTDLNSWTTKSSMSQARYYHDSAIADDVLYVFGGTSDGATALDSVEAYDILTDTGWTVKTAMPRARFAFGATTVVMQ